MICPICNAVVPTGGSCHGVYNIPSPPTVNDTLANARQVGGDHYTKQAIQPWDVIDTWPLEQRIGFYRGNLLKYTMRMNDKDAPADNIGKAEHYAQKLAEVLRDRV